MRKYRKYLAFLLSLLLISGLLAGCSNAPEKTTVSPTPSSTPKPAESAAPSQEPVKEDITAMPIVDTKQTFSIWCTFYDFFNGKIDDFNGLLGAKALEEVTNIHIDWQHPSSADLAAGFSLMLASEDYPDMIADFGTYYKSSLSQAVADGIALDLTDVADKYLPNYVDSMRDLNIIQDAYNDEGRLIGLWSLSKTVTGKKILPYAGLIIRDDWLKELGLQIPETYDEYESVLLALKEAKNLKAPLNLGYSMNISGSPCLLGGYGIGAGFYKVNGGDTIGYGPYTEEFREVLRVLNRWFEEGIFDSEFTTRSNTERALVSDNQSAMWFWSYTMLGKSAYNTGRMVDPNSYNVSVQDPVRNKGDVSGFGLQNEWIGTLAVITPSCEDLVTLLKWTNYLYTEEGALTRSYGKEGTSYTVRDDGYILINDKWFDEYWGMENAASIYSVDTFVGVGYLPGFEYATTSYLYKDAAGTTYGYNEELEGLKSNWVNNSGSYLIPKAVTLTAEESTENTAIIVDCETLAQEMYVRYISGADDIEDDAVWQNYLSQLETMGIKKAIANMQKAYDRYINRNN